MKFWLYVQIQNKLGLKLSLKPFTLQTFIDIEFLLFAENRCAKYLSNLKIRPRLSNNHLYKGSISTFSVGSQSKPVRLGNDLYPQLIDQLKCRFNRIS